MNRVASAAAVVLMVLMNTPACSEETSTGMPPNVILILADDQGWTGSSLLMDPRIPESKSDLYQTPSLEKLATEGMVFSNAYAPAPNCSPTRMSLQTGKSAVRLGATDIVDVVPDESGKANYQSFYERFYLNKPLQVRLPILDLPDDEITIAELLKQKDPRYATAHFGKWHMNGGSPGRHGYDEHNGLTANAEGLAGNPDPKLSRAITLQSIEFMQRQVKSQRPFFLQVSYYAVHTPLHAAAATIAKYKGLDSYIHTNTRYAAMTEEMDRSLGKILAAVDSLGVSGKTYVIYTSDNGGEEWVTSNAPLARGKTHLREGGIRVPLVIRGPGIPAGSRTDVPAIGYDLLPTIAEWTGATDYLPNDIDGGSLDTVLAGGTGAVERQTEALIWYYSGYRNHKHVVPHAAIRKGNYKLIREFDTDRTYLFDLARDLSETTDMSQFEPEIAKDLMGELDDYFDEVGIKRPTINPDYDPDKDLGLQPFVPKG